MGRRQLVRLRLLPRACSNQGTQSQHYYWTAVSRAGVAAGEQYWCGLNCPGYCQSRWLAIGVQLLSGVVGALPDFRIALIAKQVCHLSLQRARKIYGHVMKENRCRGIALCQPVAVMRNLGSAIHKPVAKRLVNRNRALRRVKQNRP